MGQRNGFSTTDRIKINRMYQCDGGVNPGPAPAPGPSPSGNCFDSRADCEFLKNLKYCANNEQSIVTFMDQSCRKTCGRCNGGQGPAPPQPPPSSNCVDQNGQCFNWARFCNDAAFSSFLTSNCARTCRKC